MNTWTAGTCSGNTSPLQRRFDTALTGDAFVMLAVLVLAALLGHMSPGSGQPARSAVSTLFCPA